MKQRGLEGIPLVLGGIIPKQDIPKMDLSIIRRVYAPRDFDLNRIMNEIIDVVARANDIKLSETEGNIRDG
jgi:(2R)-ethylmalonyl-CoA mutase